VTTKKRIFLILAIGRLDLEAGSSESRRPVKNHLIVIMAARASFSFTSVPVAESSARRTVRESVFSFKEEADVSRDFDSTIIFVLMEDSLIETITKRICGLWVEAVITTLREGFRVDVYSRLIGLITRIHIGCGITSFAAIYFIKRVFLRTKKCIK